MTEDESSDIKPWMSFASTSYEIRYSEVIKAPILVPLEDEARFIFCDESHTVERLPIIPDRRFNPFSRDAQFVYQSLEFHTVYRREYQSDAISWRGCVFSRREDEERLLAALRLAEFAILFIQAIIVPTHDAIYEREFAIIESKANALYTSIVAWACAQIELALLGSRKRQRRTLARFGFRGRRGAVAVKAL